MTDSTLDDFFAKKHKGKKGKYTTTTTIVKKLEESTKRSGNETLREVKRDKEKPSPPTTNLTPAVPIQLLEQEADDWKDIEEEKEKDYTGLRIQALTLSEKEESEDQQESQTEENGEEGGKSADTGPWKLNQPQRPDSPEVECPPTAAPSTPPPPSKPAVYRPPSARMAQTTTVPSRPRGNKTAPEINSELHFPSLSSAVEATAKSTNKSSNSDRNFQSVRHGARSKMASMHQAPHLDLENKFAALHQH